MHLFSRPHFRSHFFIRALRAFTGIFLSLLFLATTVISIFPSPVSANNLIPTVGHASAVSGGVFHTLYLQAGALYAWGGNDFGQLGDGTNITRFMPVAIQLNGNSLTNISAGSFHSLAVDHEGNVLAWGNNSYGQLGDGTQTDRNNPVQISGISNVISVYAGDRQSYALKGDGTVWTWGDNIHLYPVQLPELSNITSLAVGEKHALALKSDGSVWAWGNNDYGQLGTGTHVSTSTPVQIPGLTDIHSISAGLGHSLALKGDGTVLAWGHNQVGQLGNGNTTDALSPQLLPNLTGVSEIRSGYFHNLALKSDGTLMAWGSNVYSQVGDESTDNYRTTPVQVHGLENVPIDSFAAGGYHNLILTHDPNSSPPNQVLAWGYNEAGQIGNGTLFHYELPTPAIVVEPQWVLHRIAGKDRIQTSIAVSREAWYYGAKTVILSRDDDFPDALTGATLAESFASPILLTKKDILSSETEDELNRLQPKQVFLLGSTGALSSEIENTLQGKGYDVIRLGGSDRYETAAKVAGYLKDHGFLKTDQAVVAYGQNFPDALAVSSLAAHQHIPILLSDTHELPSATQNALKAIDIKGTIIVGGTGVIGPEVEAQLPSPVRYAGLDRYQTALEIAHKMGADATTIYIATGKNFPDALAGSVMASWTNSPIILVDDRLPDGFWTNPQTSPKREIFLLGGTGVVPQEIFNEFNQKLPLLNYDYSLVE